MGSSWFSRVLDLKDTATLQFTSLLVYFLTTDLVF